jgi:ATP-dependent DNA helicase 2 subunit 1
VYEETIGAAPAAELDKEAALAHGLWTCSELIRVACGAARAGSGVRRVLLLTNDPSPLRAGSEGGKALERAALLADLKISVQVLPLSSAAEFGAPRGFYRRLHNDPDAPPPGGCALSDALAPLCERLRRKAHKKRRLCALELRLAPGAPPDGDAAAAAAAPCRIAVGLFSLLAPATKAAPIVVDRASYTPLTRVTSLTCADTTEMLAPADVRRALPYGAAGHVVLSPSEAAAAKRSPTAAGLNVLGFAPRATAAALRPSDTLRPAYFAYPEEGVRPGSAAAFTALLGAMASRDVIAVATLTRAPGAAPRLVALIPQARPLMPRMSRTHACMRAHADAAFADAAMAHACVSPQREVKDKDSGAQTAPPGLHVLPLPYADDVRAHVPHAVLPVPLAPADADGAGAHGDGGEAAAAAEAAAQLGDATQAVVRALSLADFRCEDFDNPALQQFYAYLETLALDEPFEPHTHDCTLPAEEGMRDGGAAHAVVAAMADALSRIAPPPEEERGGGAGGGAGGAKKRKAAAGADEEADAKRIAGADSVRRLGPDNLARAKVDELKAYLKDVGLKPGAAKKDELMAKVREHMIGGA